MNQKFLRMFMHLIGSKWIRKYCNKLLYTNGDEGATDCLKVMRERGMLED